MRNTQKIEQLQSSYDNVAYQLERFGDITGERKLLTNAVNRKETFTEAELYLIKRNIQDAAITKRVDNLEVVSYLLDYTFTANFIK